MFMIPSSNCAVRSHAMFDDWCRLLEEESGIDVGFRRCGGLYLARTNGELATLEANQAWWDEHGIAFQRWSPDETAQHVPELRWAVKSNLKSTWFLPDECQIRNPRYLKALEAACRKRGVLIHENEPMMKLEQEASTLYVQTSLHRYAAERVCITAGAWTALTTLDQPLQTGIYPVRGQMVLFRGDAPLFQPVINEGHRYLVPRDDGFLLAGSCEEEVGFDERTTPEMIEPLTQWARDLIPSLESVPVVRSWSGLRPGSIDGLPYLGKVPHYENLYLAAGHFRHGLHLSPITAQCMFALMAGQPTSVDLSPFRLTRGKTYSSA